MLDRVRADDSLCDAVNGESDYDFGVDGEDDVPPDGEDNSPGDEPSRDERSEINTVFSGPHCRVFMSANCGMPNAEEALAVERDNGPPASEGEGEGESE